MKKKNLDIIEYRIFLAIIIVLNILLRLHFASQAEFPLVPNNNPVHINIADNLYNGKGFTENYIYIYTDNLSPEITHPSNGIFMPLTSVIIYISYRLFGYSLFSISIFSILGSLLISLFIFLFTKELSESKTTRMASILFSLFLPSFFTESIMPVSTIYSTLFILWALYWIMLGLKKNSVFMILSAIPAVAATLTSLVGFSIFPVILILGLQNKKIKIWKNIFWFFIVSFILLFPWFFRNYLSFGSFLTIRFDKLIFLRSFDDLFSYSKDISPGAFFLWGFQNIITFKIKSIILFMVIMIKYATPIIACLGLTGIFITFLEKSIKKELAGYFFLFVTILFFVGFMFAAAAENEILQNSISSFIPFFIIFSAIGIERIISNKMYRKIFVVLAFFLLVYGSISDSRSYIKNSSEQSKKYERLKNYLQSRKIEKTGIMTCYPAEMNLITGMPSVMIPTESDSVVFSTAKKFNIDYIHIVPNAKNSVNFENEQNLRLIYIDYNSDFRLYRIVSDSLDDKIIPGK
jgi:4-amino-4-deoxy-L-arabinose transferase-like glycosyltransferase